MTTRTRTCFSFVPVRKMGTRPNGVLELHILWQGRRNFSLFSTSPKKSAVKVPFGMVKAVDFKNEARNASSGEIVCGYNITNRSEKKNNFSRRITSIHFCGKVISSLRY